MHQFKTVSQERLPRKHAAGLCCKAKLDPGGVHVIFWMGKVGWRWGLRRIINDNLGQRSMLINDRRKMLPLKASGMQIRKGRK
jgi:hypothetical protein